MKAKKIEWNRGDKIPDKPKVMYRTNKTTNKKEMTNKAKLYRSYQTKIRKSEKQLEQKKLTTGYEPKTQYRSEDLVRVIFRFDSSKKPSAHSPLFLRAIIEGKREDIYELRQILYNKVKEVYGEDVADIGSYYEENIDRISLPNATIKYRRSERDIWRTYV
jgi:hypothetical protein